MYKVIPPSFFRFRTDPIAGREELRIAHGGLSWTLHTPSRRRLLDGVAVHPTHWLICTGTGTSRAHDVRLGDVTILDINRRRPEIGQEAFGARLALIPPSVKKTGAARTDSFDFSQSATANGVGCTTAAVNYAYDTVADPMVFAVSVRWTTIFSYAAEFTKGIVNSVGSLVLTVVQATIFPMKVVILILGLSVLVEVGNFIMNLFDQFRRYLLRRRGRSAGARRLGSPRGSGA
mmetsp:Transcript_17308/g.49427  ORF Transcript_17308/g.49427 Transcript_17308/m.49427 type:complete len:233 (+) Transcript_17308:3449-4147(+)